MKILSLFLSTLLVATTAPAQNTWTVQLNSTTILSASQEDTVKNQVLVNDLKKGSLIISYKELPNADFARSISIYSMADEELYKKREATVIIPVSLLKQWAKKGLPVKVYTMLVPLNPNIAVRLRRVHLCTINFG